MKKLNFILLFVIIFIILRLESLGYIMFRDIIIAFLISGTTFLIGWFVALRKLPDRVEEYVRKAIGKDSNLSNEHSNLSSEHSFLEKNLKNENDRLMKTLNDIEIQYLKELRDDMIKKKSFNNDTASSIQNLYGVINKIERDDLLISENEKLKILNEELKYENKNMKNKIRELEHELDKGKEKGHGLEL